MLTRVNYLSINTSISIAARQEATLGLLICTHSLDLLHHFDNVRDPNALVATWPQTVDWFAHPSPPPRQRGETYHSHLNEHWSQWDISKQFKLPDIVEDEPRKTLIREKEDVKLPPITKRDDVEFGRLLSLDYQREWIQNKEEKEKLQKQRSKVGVCRGQFGTLKLTVQAFLFSFFFAGA